MAFPIKLRKKDYLLTIIALNVFCCICSFFFNCNKQWEISFASSLLEFLIIHWCVWNSIITIVYSIKELLTNKKDYQAKKKLGNFGIVVAVSNFTSIVGFASFLFTQKGMNNLVTKPISWLIYSAIWHFISMPLSIFYFFKYTEIDKNSLQKKNLFYTVLPMPIIFFLANLARRMLMEKIYLDKPFSKFMVWWFNYFENQEFTYLFFWIIFSFFYFWLAAFLLTRKKKPAKLIKIPLMFFSKHH